MFKRKPDVYHTRDLGLFMGTKRIPQDSSLYGVHTRERTPQAARDKGRDYLYMAVACMTICTIGATVEGLYFGEPLFLLMALIMLGLVALLVLGGD